MIFFTAAGNRIGSYSVNVIRLTFALPLLGGATLLFFGSDIVSLFAGGKPLLLALSGIIGLTFGDAALFYALVLIGPRKTTLIFSSVPIVTTLFAFALLGEQLGALAWLGIFLTVSGVSWVVAERSKGRFQAEGRQKWLGISVALIGTICQAIGLVLSKAGMNDAVDPLPATLLRIFSGLIGVYVWTLASGKVKLVTNAVKDTRAIVYTFGGAVFGPFAGVWLSVAAVRFTEAGIAATLMGTVPIMIIPVVYFVYSEKVSWRAFIGTIIAAAGIALLFQR